MPSLPPESISSNHGEFHVPKRGAITVLFAVSMKKDLFAGLFSYSRNRRSWFLRSLAYERDAIG